MNAVISLPFDQKEFLTIEFLHKNKIFDELFCFVESPLKNKHYNFNAIYKYSDLSTFLNYISTGFPVFEANSELSVEKKNLMDIVNRWARTYGISNTYLALDRITNKILEYWHDFILNNNIETLILGNVPHTPHDYSLYIIMKWLNRKVIVITPMPNFETNGITLIFSHDVSMDCIFEMNLGSCDFQKLENRVDISNILIRIRDENLLLKYPVFTNYINADNLSYFYKKIRRILLYRRPAVILNKIIYEIKYFLSLRINANYKSMIKKMSYSKVLSNIDYFFFPLHYQPEATTIPTGGIFRDQLLIIKLASSLLPHNKYLVVKEHPAYFPSRRMKTRIKEPITDYRNIWFYNEIQELENVILVDTFKDSIELLRASKGIITVSGSISLEALKYSVPVLVFGNHYYKHLPNSKYANSSKIVYDFLNLKHVNTDYEEKTNEFYEKLMNNSVFIQTDPLEPNLNLENVLDSGFFELLNRFLMQEIKVKLKLQ